MLEVAKGRAQAKDDEMCVMGHRIAASTGHTQRVSAADCGFQESFLEKFPSSLERRVSVSLSLTRKSHGG